MDEQKEQQLYAMISSEEREILDTLKTAQQKTHKEYAADPTALKKRDWDAAQQGLQNELDQLSAKYLQGGNLFENRNAVVQYLKEQGYKVGKTKLYQDSNSGLLRTQSDGSVLKSDVELYINAYLVGKKTAGNSESALSQRKMELEIERLERQVREQDLEYDKKIGKLIPRDEVELELATRAVVLEAGLTSLVHSNAADWVFQVKGKPEFVDSLKEAIIEDLHVLLNEYAQVKTFQVLFDDAGN